MSSATLSLFLLPLVFGAGPSAAPVPPEPPPAKVAPEPLRDPQRADAWATWSRWQRGAIPRETLELVRALELDKEFTDEELRKLSAAEDGADSASMVLKWGLVQQPCLAPGGKGAQTVVDLGDSVALGGLLAGLQRSRSAPVLVDLFTASHKMARCRGGTVSFEVGRILKNRALTVLWWLAERRLVLEEDVRPLSEVLRKNTLSVQELIAALAHEAESLSSQLPADPDVAGVWSRVETETLLSQQVSQLQASLGKGDVPLAAMKASVARLLDAEDERYLAARGVRQPQDVRARLGEASQVPPPSRPNVFGRFLASRSLATVVQLAARAQDDLPEQRASQALARAGLEFIALPKGATLSPQVLADPYGGTFLVDGEGVHSRGPDQVDGNDDDLWFSPRATPPRLNAVEVDPTFGMCRQRAPGRYVLNADALRNIRAGKDFAVLSQTRLRHAYENEVFIGFSVAGFSPNSFFGTCGFKDGDLVLQVNGHPINTADGMGAAQDSVERTRRAKVQLLRNGKRMTLVIEAPP